MSSRVIACHSPQGSASAEATEDGLSNAPPSTAYSNASHRRRATNRGHHGASVSSSSSDPQSLATSSSRTTSSEDKKSIMTPPTTPGSGYDSPGDKGATMTRRWRFGFVLLLAVQLAGAVYLIVTGQELAAEESRARNQERFDAAGDTLLLDLNHVFEQKQAALHQWRHVAPLIDSAEEFDLIFNRPEYHVESVWLPRVEHAERAAFEAATYADMSQFLGSSAGLSPNITAVQLNGTLEDVQAAIGRREVSPVKPEYFPIRYAAPPLPPHYYMQDSVSPVCTGLVPNAIAAKGEMVASVRALFVVGSEVQVVSALAAAVMSRNDSDVVVGVMTVSINWQTLIQEQITLPTPGPVHARIFDSVPSDDCVRPLLFSGTHNRAGTWTLAPAAEYYKCVAGKTEAVSTLGVAGRTLFIEFTRAEGFDNGIDSTQVLVESAFLVGTVLMLLFISGTGSFVFHYMERAVKAIEVYSAGKVKAEQEAREATEHRNQFLAFLSHELRNPLFGLRGTIDEGLELAGDCEDVQLAPRLDATFNTLQACTQQIERTLNTVVNVQNMASGKIDLCAVPFATRALVDKLTAGIARYARVRNIDVKVSVSEDVPTVVVGDFRRIAEAIGHLLRNAVQYSRKHATVTLRVELQPDAMRKAPKRTRMRSIRIGPAPHAYTHEYATSEAVCDAQEGQVALQFVVVDQGAGLKLRQMKRAFQPYTRQRIASASQKRGSNLGLPVAKLLCKQMGGYMRVRSGPDQGSEFTAVMLVQIAHESDLPAPVEEISMTPGLPQTNASTVQSLVVSDEVQVSSTAWSAAASEEVQQQVEEIDVSTFEGRFLAVDDQKINRRLVSRILSKLTPKATVDTAEDGLDAVTKVAAAAEEGEPYSCIFMDIQMPRMSGTQATRKLRLSGFSKPIIAVTGGTLEEEIAKYLRAGMVAVIHKPCKKAHFEAKLREFWADVNGLGVKL